MFGLGFFEILLILAGILVFVRPQDLPGFIYRVGKVYGQIKDAYHKFFREINLIKNQMDQMVEKDMKLNQKNQETTDKDSQGIQVPPPKSTIDSSQPLETAVFNPGPKSGKPKKSSRRKSPLQKVIKKIEESKKKPVEKPKQKKAAKAVKTGSKPPSSPTQKKIASRSPKKSLPSKTTKKRSKPAN